MCPAPPPDRFRRLSLLGEGGSGRVWLAEDPLRPGRRMALKEPLDGNPATAERLRREFALLARFRHPGLPEAFELDLGDPERPVFTQDYVDGDTLPVAVDRGGVEVCLELAAEGLQILAFLHDFGLTHRDLKPENLLVRRRPRLGRRLVLLDLGLALSGADEGTTGPAGTLPYLAPELFDGEPPGPRSDLYGLGAVLWESIHGRPPFDPAGRDLDGFVQLVREGRRARPAPPAPYPGGFGNWLEELLAPEAACRPAGAREALGRLNATCGTRFAADDGIGRAARLASDPPAGREPIVEHLRASLSQGRGPRLTWLVGGPASGKSRILRWFGLDRLEAGWDLFCHPGPRCDTPHEFDELLERSRQRPTLCVIDDAATLTPAWQQRLARFVRDDQGPPLQLLVGIRPGESASRRLDGLLDRTSAVPMMERVELEPLDDEALQAMAARVDGTRSLSAARMKTLAALSDRNPLIAGSLLVEGDQESVRGDIRPRGLETSIDTRMRLLSDDARRWIESLAVVGAAVLESTVTTLADLPAEAAQTAAEESRLAGLARICAGRWSTDSRSVGEIVAGSLSPDTRTAMHRRAAEELPALDPEAATPWRLARLWRGAGEEERSIEEAIRAADESLEKGAPEQAATRLAFALRQLPRRDPRRRGLRRRQAETLIAAGRFAEAARALGAALRLSRDAAEQVEIRAHQAETLVRAGRFRGARRVAAVALAAAGDDAPGARVRAGLAEAIALARLGHEAEALPLFESVAADAHLQQDPGIEAEALHGLATCKARLRMGDAESDFNRAIETYQAIGDSARELRSRLGVATVRIQTGQRQVALGMLEEIDRRATDDGHLDLAETALSKPRTWPWRTERSTGR